MYMQEVLELVCRKRKIDDPKDWALLSDDLKILVPLDRTVASLEGNLRLVLVQREMLPDYGFAIDADRRTARSIDPNGRRISYSFQAELLFTYIVYFSFDFQADFGGTTEETSHRGGL